MTFANTYLLYIIPILIISIGIGFYFSEKKYLSLIDAFSKLHSSRNLFSSYSKTFRRFKQSLIILGALSLLLALARPQWGFSYLETKSKGIDILFALDVSQSMLAQDLKPNRLERSKLAIYDFIEQLHGDRIGLIAFAGDAFLQCPLTLDYNAFIQTLDALNTDVINTQGTNLASAIKEAEKTFQKNSKDKVLILITDGEDLEGAGFQKAIQAHKEGLRIYTVGVGTQEGDIIPIKTARGQVDYLKDQHGKIVKTRLEPQTLQAIAQATDGYFTVLGKTGDGLQTVYSMIEENTQQQEFKAHLQKIPHEQFQWFLGFALLCLLLEKLVGSKNPFSKKRYFDKNFLSSYVFVLFLLLAPQALEASASKAYKAYQVGRYDEAVKLYQEATQKHSKDNRYHYNLGSSYYQVHNYEDALSEFNIALPTDSTKLQEKIFYNLGNTQYQLGTQTEENDPKATIKQWKSAIKQYENALELEPKNENTQHNLAFVKKRLQELKQKQQEQQRQKDSQQDSQDQQQEKNSEDSGQPSDKEKKQEDSKNFDNKEQEKSSEKNKNEDRESQQKEANEGKEQEPKKKSQGDPEKENENEQQNNHKKEASTQGLPDSQQKTNQVKQQQEPDNKQYGAMSQGEAAQLLNASQGSEKTLLLNTQQGQNQKPQKGPVKNW